MRGGRCLLLFSKPSHPGRVKTRLIGELSAGEAAALHAAFQDDLLDRLRGGDFDLQVAWALGPDEPLPAVAAPGVRQEGADLGERLWGALRRAAQSYPVVAAVGSDHPDLPTERIHDAFARLETGSPVVLGPAEDGGYYLVGARAETLDRALFARIPWSTDRVLATTLERCRELGLEPSLLAPARDVDTPADLRRLAAELAADGSGCPRTRALLAAWGRLPAAAAR
jgi:rSAM/selenodomain-associated transferase 1